MFTGRRTGGFSFESFHFTFEGKEKVHVIMFIVESVPSSPMVTLVYLWKINLKDDELFRVFFNREKTNNTVRERKKDTCVSLWLL